MTGRADGNTVRSDGNAMIIVGFLSVAEIQINKRHNVFLSAKTIHRHRIMGGIKEQLIRHEMGSKSAVTEERFTKAVRIVFRR